MQRRHIHTMRWVSWVLSHCLITYDLFLPRDCKIYSKLGDPVCLEHLQLWECYSQNSPGNAKWYAERRDCLSGWRRERTSPTNGPIERGQYEHWAPIASVLEHKDNVGTTLLKFVLVSLILCLPVVLVSLFLLVRFNTKTHPCKMCVRCDSASMRMHGDEAHLMQYCS